MKVCCIEISLEYTSIYLSICFLLVIVKKGYYKLVKVHHPDRVPESEKLHAKEKFQIIHQAYQILSNVDQKKKYDEGSIVLFSNDTITAQWNHYLKPVADIDIDIARNEHQNSDQEKIDIEREYRAGKGSMKHIMNNVPFLRAEDEPRVKGIINELVNIGRLEKIGKKK